MFEKVMFEKGYAKKKVFSMCNKIIYYKKRNHLQHTTLFEFIFNFFPYIGVTFYTSLICLPMIFRRINSTLVGYFL